MNYFQRWTILPGLLLTGMMVPVTAGAQFWEIPDPALPHIAMVRADPQWGHAVIYNPDLCQQIGAACAFFRAHEYAHGALNDPLLPPGYYPPSMETRADCWAAKYIKTQEASAALSFFLEIDKYPGIPVSGDPAQRAQTISECAKIQGKD